MCWTVSLAAVFRGHNWTFDLSCNPLFHIRVHHLERKSNYPEICSSHGVMSCPGRSPEHRVFNVQVDAFLRLSRCDDEKKTWEEQEEEEEERWLNEESEWPSVTWDTSHLSFDCLHRLRFQSHTQMQSGCLLFSKGQHWASVCSSRHFRQFCVYISVPLDQ